LTPRDYGTVRVLPATGYGVGKPDPQYTRAEP